MSAKQEKPVFSDAELAQLLLTRAEENRALGFGGVAGLEALRQLVTTLRGADSIDYKQTERAYEALRACKEADWHKPPIAELNAYLAEAGFVAEGPASRDLELTLAWLSGVSGSEEDPGEHLTKAIRISRQSVSWFPPYAERVLASLEG
jgi:hypothetical protein